MLAARLNQSAMEVSPDISRPLNQPLESQAGGFRLNARWRFFLLALAAAILFLGAIRLGDLAGYDDALYALEAKGIVHDGEWLTPKRAGGPALEHPPLFVWTEAVFLSTLGVSDFVAKLPTALCALGTILLSYWLARRLLKDTLAASVAMFVMLATPYFIKYAGRAMTDVPTTFLFLCAICAWSLSEDDHRWYIAAGIFTAMALTVRGLIGVALPIIFAIDLLARRRNPRGETKTSQIQWRWLIPSLAIALLPVTAWYAYQYFRYQGSFVNANGGWLSREVFGSLNPPWRRYTGVFEYAWMLIKSYWPWLPATVGGIVMIGRERRRSLFVLLGWAATVFLLCAAARSRVLRYMLPAYPAFAILAAIGLMKWIPRRILDRAMNWIPPFAVAASLAIVLLWPPGWHATEIRAIAQVHDRVLSSGERVGFYDKGDPRYDETNDLEWYGNQTPVDLDSSAFEDTLRTGSLPVLVVDRATYEQRVRSLPHDVLVESGHLISVRLRPH
jgi:4-amino-4-deoxy-L-arabinose transferase-like glycosyltransferase